MSGEALEVSRSVHARDQHGPWHPGPNLLLLAGAFTALKLASISVVSNLAGIPAFPGLGEPPAQVAAYFQTYPAWVLWCAFLQIGSAIPLGLFAATAVSRLRFLGVRAAGVDIALFAGLMVAFDSAASGFVLWTLTQPGIAQDGVLANALSFLSFGFGGPGFAMPMGLLIAGVSLTGGLSRLLPRWLMWLGLALAAAGELSWLALILPGALFLIPLTRFPAFVWLLLTAWLLPNRAAAREAEATR